MSFLGTLFLIFLVLKLTDVIGWSWWIVTMPLWGAFALAILLAAILTAVNKSGGV